MEKYIKSALSPKVATRAGDEHDTTAAPGQFGRQRPTPPGKGAADNERLRGGYWR